MTTTIQQAIDQRLSIFAACSGIPGRAPHCRRTARLDLGALKERLGPDHGAMHDDLVPKLRCSECGGRNVGLVVIPCYDLGRPGARGLQ